MQQLSQKERGDTLFYEQLKEVCRKKHTTPTAVCLAIGLSRSNVTSWKNGRPPRLDVVIRLAEYLNVPVTRLIPKNTTNHGQ